MRTRVELLLYIPTYELFQTTIGLPQILQMMKDRGLIIRDDNDALRQLKSMSYFRLANYLRPMEQDKTTHIFKPNSYFDNAVNLYFF